MDRTTEFLLFMAVLITFMMVVFNAVDLESIQNQLDEIQAMEVFDGAE